MQTAEQWRTRGCGGGGKAAVWGGVGWKEGGMSHTRASVEGALPLHGILFSAPAPELVQK